MQFMLEPSRYIAMLKDRRRERRSKAKKHKPYKKVVIILDCPWIEPEITPEIELPRELLNADTSNCCTQAEWIESCSGI